LKSVVVVNGMNGKFDEFVVETLARLKDPGCLLVGAKKDGACNVMAIGWGFVGVFWRMPVFLVAVRHSRFTHEFIEDSDEFTVNVPDERLDKAVGHCGEVSGREHDKFKECKLSLLPGRR
jgi:flavin reductase (DIM6/NTAB) family NADH-FMN oxidoreductase RutF